MAGPADPLTPPPPLPGGALIDAFRFDGTGRAARVGWEDIDQPHDGPGFLWVHLQRTAEETRTWLTEKSGLPALVCEALLAADSRPRTTAFGEGLVVDIRGVNMNPGEDPEDMVSLRVWSDGVRVVSVRRRKLMAVDDVREAITRNHAPKTPSELVLMLADGLTVRMGAVIAGLDERVDDLEERVVVAQSQELRLALGAIRREAIMLRRFIGPNREAIQQLVNDPADWMDQGDRLRMREVADKITRYVEELDAARERAAVVQDELSSRLAERLNNNTYVLSVIAAIFLPLGLLTGLLGINVGGMPGADWDPAFWIVTALLVVIGGIEYVLLRRLRWI